MSNEVTVKKLNKGWVPSDANDRDNGGVFITAHWVDIETWLRDAARVTDTEVIDLIRVDDNGLRIRISPAE